jgi:hypothetical protein
MNKRKNRSLDTIADDIHKLARSNIFDIGACLLVPRHNDYDSLDVTG